MGWATPILLLAKNFFRKVWAETEKWDEPLSRANQIEWAEISNKLQEIPKIKLPRYLQLKSNGQTVQLHAFVDASAVAYAIVVYIRIQSAEKCHTSIISSKTRLTPVKPLTTPKLELIAILLGSRYIAFVKQALNFDCDVDTFIWSDSKCALAWMTQNKILPTVIEKYIAEAKSYGITQTRYVPSQMNFADIATRGADFSTLQGMQWWDGPHWLRDELHWPADELSSNPENNISLIFQNKLMLKQTIKQEDEIEGIATLNIKHFSSLPQLLKRTAYVLQAATKFRRTNFLQLQSLIDTATAEKLWVKWDQDRIYATENEPECSKRFFLRNISVFRDEDGIIRSSTRITNSMQNLDTISPILLVKNSTLTRLIILHTHTTHKHAGTNHTLANLRQRYWLPHGRRQVYQAIFQHCYECRKQISQAYPNPPPAPLPEFRVLRSQRPFQVVGVDIFGPFMVRHIETSGYIRQKRWVLIFTCATIRAIHLETITEMTTEEISHSFRRFFARRGVPKKFLSDNAPQFHALDGYFHSLWHTLAKAPSISNYFAEHQISWEFITEFAPWMGGLYERLIQTVKVAFEKTYGSKTLMSRQFDTAMVEIEAIVNSRPIAYVDTDPDSPVLTPNDFLMAKYVAIPIKNETQNDDDTIKKLWKSSQAYLDEFWKAWANQYLLLLRDRNDQLPRQNRTSKYRPQKGDVVVMQDFTKKRSAWQLAVIERLIPGTDGEIRSVQIRIPTGSRLIRPVISLAPLRIKMDLPNVHDHQLNTRRDAIVVWPTEEISQHDPNPNEQTVTVDEEDGAGRHSDNESRNSATNEVDQ